MDEGFGALDGAEALLVNLAVVADDGVGASGGMVTSWPLLLAFRTTMLSR